MAELPIPRIRSYNPETDYPGVLITLTEANIFDPDRDTPEQLARYADSVIIADLTATEGEGLGVIGSVYVTRGIMPIIYRLAVRERLRNRGVGELLLGAAMDVLEQDGHPDAGVFVDANDQEVRDWYAKRKFREGKVCVELWRYVQDLE